MPSEIKEVAEEKEEIFRRDPFDACLKTHKLHGKLNDFWSFSIGYKYRVVFEFGKNNVVYFHLAGNHKIYQ